MNNDNSVLNETITVLTRISKNVDKVIERESQIHKLVVDLFTEGRKSDNYLDRFDETGILQKRAKELGIEIK